MNLHFLAPELVLTAVAILFLLGESFWPNIRRSWVVLSILALLITGGLVLKTPESQGLVLGMMSFDGVSQFFKIILLVGSVFVLALSFDYREFQDENLKNGEKMNWGTYSSLLLLSTVGLLLLVSSRDFLMVLISLELISVTSFILTGFLKKNKRSNEAALKFFLVGALSSGLMVYGISLLYGVTGNTNIQDFLAADLVAYPKIPLVGAVLFILAGLGFKMAMVPFHMWVPDAYEGAPMPITAYLSVAPKAAAFGVLIKTFPNHQALNISFILAVLTAVTMTVGNFSALKQTNIKRMLAYSSIAQMGYVLVGFVSAGTLGMGSVLIYTAAYLFMNLGAFACVISIYNQTKTEELDGFCGLVDRSFPMALITTVFMLSLTGLPPLIGFIGKFSIFSAAVSEGWIWLAAVGMLNSVVSLYYYLGVVYRIFFREPLQRSRVSWAFPLTSCVLVSLFVTLYYGVFPNTLIHWVQTVLN